MTTRAVVLARGLGRRMQQADPAADLTDAQRRAADAGLKGMMPVNGRPFLDFVLGRLADTGIQDVGLVVAPDHEVMRRYYESEHPPSRIRLAFAVQRDAIGTANAVLAAESWTAGEPFLVLNSDNLYPTDVLQRLAGLNEPGLACFRREELVQAGNIPEERVRSFALIDVEADGYLHDILEKPPAARLAHAGASAIVSMNCWRFDSRIFRFCREVSRSPRGELELPEAVRLAVNMGVRFRCVPAGGAVFDLSCRRDAAEVARRLAAVSPRL